MERIEDDDSSEQYIPDYDASSGGGTFTLGNTLPVSPFVMNRGYAQYNPSRIISQEVHGLVKHIKDVPVKQQRRIRNDLNNNRSKDQQIMYSHINPNSADFDETYARLIVAEYNSLTYLRETNERYDREALDPEIFREVSTYSTKMLKKNFNLVPLAVRKEIMDALGCSSENISHYTKEVKQKIITIFKSQYME